MIYVVEVSLRIAKDVAEIWRDENWCSKRAPMTYHTSSPSEQIASNAFQFNRASTAHLWVARLEETFPTSEIFLKK